MAQLSLLRRIFGSARPGERRSQARAGTPRGLQVLIVDDSATIRAALGKMLLQNGHVVLSAGSGDVALELARENVPDLVFLDIVMPGMSGFAVLRALRRDARTLSIPVIMISGNPQATEQFYVQRFGADDFMKKPFGRAEVFARISRLSTSGRLTLAKRVQHEHVMPIPAPRADDLTASSGVAAAQGPGPGESSDQHG